MQSIRQYHRFGKHVRAQYERDKAKVKAIDDQSSESTTPFSSTSTASTAATAATTDVRDPEKAEHAPAQGEPLSALASAEQAFETRTLEHASRVPTHSSTGTTLGAVFTGIHIRDRTTKERSLSDSTRDQKVFVVGYEGESDVLDPHNWSYGTRIWATVNIAFIGWIVGFASSVDSAALVQAAEDLGVSEVTESLATGLFLVGFGVGTLCTRQIQNLLSLLRTVADGYHEQVRCSRDRFQRPLAAIRCISPHSPFTWSS